MSSVAVKECREKDLGAGGQLPVGFRAILVGSEVSDARRSGDTCRQSGLGNRTFLPGRAADGAKDAGTGAGKGTIRRLSAVEGRDSGCGGGRGPTRGGDFGG